MVYDCVSTFSDDVFTHTHSHSLRHAHACTYICVLSLFLWAHTLMPNTHSYTWQIFPLFYHMRVESTHVSMYLYGWLLAVSAFCSLSLCLFPSHCPCHTISTMMYIPNSFSHACICFTFSFLSAMRRRSKLHIQMVYWYFAFLFVSCHVQAFCYILSNVYLARCERTSLLQFFSSSNFVNVYTTKMCELCSNRRHTFAECMCEYWISPH